MSLACVNYCGCSVLLSIGSASCPFRVNSYGPLCVVWCVRFVVVACAMRCLCLCVLVDVRFRMLLFLVVV